MAWQMYVSRDSQQGQDYPRLMAYLRCACSLSGSSVRKQVQPEELTVICLQWW